MSCGYEQLFSLGRSGHMVRYCPMSKNQDRESNQAQASYSNPGAPNTTNKHIFFGGFIREVNSTPVIWLNYRGLINPWNFDTTTRGLSTLAILNI